MNSNSLAKKWGGNFKSIHITKKEKESIKNSVGSVEIGLLGLIVGIILLVEFLINL